MYSACLVSLSFSLASAALPTSATLESLAFYLIGHTLVSSHLPSIFPLAEILFLSFSVWGVSAVLGIPVHIYFLHEAFFGFSWGESWSLHTASQNATHQVGITCPLHYILQ